MKLKNYVSEFKDEGLSTDARILFCSLCDIKMISTKRFLVQQQTNNEIPLKSQLFLAEPTTSYVRSEPKNDFCCALIRVDIPLHKTDQRVAQRISGELNCTWNSRWINTVEKIYFKYLQ